ncbi:antibiotic biosynthesis monooxygenase [Streptoverticillium reticulum]|uniref:antibiotic biosynthesis monooxygenase n=1 Tax=Streptoverticillium reticulum TaxID=1433415 RepID=UPI0039BFD563
MITVTAKQQVKPGREEELDALMAALRNDILANEPGCLRFDYVRDQDTPLRRLVIEEYRDEAALEFHRGTTYLREFLPRLLPCLEEFPEVTTYRTVAPVPDSVPDGLFHVGMVVPDLEKAVALHSDVLGVEFTEPHVFRIPLLEDPDPHPAELTAVFSRTGAPYYELIQAAGDGIISAEHCGRILYYGVWEPDMAARLEQLERQGVGIDAYFRPAPGETPFAVITAPDLLGARIEYVGLADRAPIEEWVRTGRYPE